MRISGNGDAPRVLPGVVCEYPILFSDILITDKT